MSDSCKIRARYVHVIASSDSDGPESAYCDTAHVNSDPLQALCDALIQGEQSGLADYDYERFIAGLDSDDLRGRI